MLQKIRKKKRKVQQKESKEVSFYASNLKREFVLPSPGPQA
jgi:hypothetical protein